ncbi:MAG TPA: exodeoxyribonuclease V subunit beta [Chthoniobacterales bacterium]
MIRFDLAQTPIERGRTLIEASAGTGKTFTLTAIFARLMIEHSLGIDEILVCTFTEAATAELRERIREMLREAVDLLNGKSAKKFEFLSEILQRSGKDNLANLEAGLRNIDQAPIFTIHGFCQRLLQDRAFESGNSLESTVMPDESEIRREVVEDFWRRYAYATDSVGARLVLTAHPIPASLERLVASVFRYPEIQLIRHGEPPDLAAAMETAKSAFEAARDTWRSASAEISELLTKDQRWAKSDYAKPEKVREWLRQILAVFTGSGDLKVVEQFGTSKLAENVNRSRKLQPPKHLFFDQCDKLSRALDDFFEAFAIEAVGSIREDLRVRKRERQLLGFGDMLENVDRSLVDMSAVEVARLRGKWCAALIDEFQDTDPVQDRIFRRLFDAQAHWIYLIGDPKQAIYGFRGADVGTYLKTGEICDRQYSLGTNHRSEKRLVEAVNALFSVSENPFEYEKIVFRRVKATSQAPRPALEMNRRKPSPLVLWVDESDQKYTNGEREVAISKAVARESKRLLENARIAGEKLRVSDIAVLTDTNRQAAIVQVAFQQQGIPAVIQSGRNIFHSPEAEAVARVLAGVLESRRPHAWRAALATPVFGLNAADIAVKEDDGSAEAWAEKFQKWHLILRHEGFMRMFDDVLRVGRVRERLASEWNGERAITNFLHLGELLHSVETLERLGPARLLQWLDERIAEENAGENAEAYEQRLETDAEAVQVMTVHRSKGLEFPVVFVPFAWKTPSGLRRISNKDEPLIYHDEQDGLLGWLHQRDRAFSEQRAMDEKIRESLRLLYVAVTRAKHRCYLTCHPGKIEKDSAVYRLLGDNVQAWKRRFPEGVIGVQSLTDDQLELDLRESRHDVQRTDFQRRVFSGEIRRDWRVASFTGLSHASLSEEPERDEITPQANANENVLPAGVNVGNCLHEILESIDFSDEMEWPSIVRRALRRAILDRPGIEALVLDMLRRTVRTRLDAGVTLDRISKANCIQEMEFMLPLGTLTPAKLRTACQGSAVPIDWERLSFPDVRGMLKGYIDLVFRHDGKFYLVDWKSNVLSAYESGTIENAMRRAHYGLQYLLYCVALRRQLMERISSFDWDRDFGGVHYIFLRGGIFSDRPSGALIGRLEALFR